MASIALISGPIFEYHRPVPYHIYQLNSRVDFCVDAHFSHAFLLWLHSKIELNIFNYWTWAFLLNERFVSPRLLLTETHFVTWTNIFSEDIFTYVYEDFPTKNKTTEKRMERKWFRIDSPNSTSKTYQLTRSSIRLGHQKPMNSSLGIQSNEHRFSRLA